MSARFSLPRRRTLAATATTALALALAACGSSTSSTKGSAMPGMNNTSMPSASAPASTMPSMDDGMDGMGTGDGLAAVKDGYQMASSTAALPTSKAADYHFTITGLDGKPVTDFAVDQTKRIHFYAIRSDLTCFQHIHPTMAADGTWTTPLAALQSGTWRLFTSFTPNMGKDTGKDFVLSRTIKAPGMPMTSALPKASATAMVDGYMVTVKDDLMAGMAHQLTATITRDGKPVTDLQPTSPPSTRATSPSPTSTRPPRPTATTAGRPWPSTPNSPSPVTGGCSCSSRPPEPSTPPPSPCTSADRPRRAPSPVRWRCPPRFTLTLSPPTARPGSVQAASGVTRVV
ncbi:hypothetical protein [Streptomyces sp. NPDC048385]|uniref:hypothetical protein n=1 Tax=unclassified Streptomyces TaxID=2593676 RepID=UPI0034349B04